MDGDRFRRDNSFRGHNDNYRGQRREFDSGSCPYGRRGRRARKRKRGNRGSQRSGSQDKFSKFRDRADGDRFAQHRQINNGASDTDNRGSERYKRFRCERTANSNVYMDKEDKGTNNAQVRNEEQRTGVDQEIRNTNIEKENFNSEAKTDCTKTEPIRKNKNTAKEPRKIQEGKVDSELNMEKSTSAAKDVIKKSSSSSSDSSSSDSDSDAPGNIAQCLRKATDKSHLKKQNEVDCQKNVAVKKEAGKTVPSSSSPDSPNPNTIRIKKEKNSEDDVVCLGKLERIENLVDNEQPSQDDATCLLCEEEGHTSFHCFMICRNCGGKYHSFKDCPKPANMSTVLQSFMEFCLSQFYGYNAQKSFSLHPEVQSDDMRNVQAEFNNEVMRNNKKNYETRSSSRSIPGSSKVSRKRFIASDTESSSDESLNIRKKTAKHKSIEDRSKSNMSKTFAASIPINTQLPPAMFPYLLNSQGMPFSPQGVAVNPYLAYAQMMGFNAMNLPNKGI